MKKLLLIFVFLFPITSYADWLKLEKDIGETVYFDTNSFKQNNGYFYIWMLTDFEKPNPNFKGALSIKMLYEADCSTPRKMKNLSVTSYKSPMGQGKYNESASLKDPKWLYVAPQSSGEKWMNFVCAEKKIITQEALRDILSKRRVGKSPDYGVVKNGDDYLATFHSYSDDKVACESAIKNYGSEYSCIQLNTASQQVEITQDQLRRLLFKYQVGKSPDYGVVKSGDDYLATFHSYSDDKAACESSLKGYGSQFKCIQLNKKNHLEASK